MLPSLNTVVWWDLLMAIITCTNNTHHVISGEPAERSLQLHHINIYDKNQITVFPFVGHKYHSVLVGKEKYLNSTQRVCKWKLTGKK